MSAFITAFWPAHRPAFVATFKSADFSAIIAAIWSALFCAFHAAELTAFFASFEPAHVDAVVLRGFEVCEHQLDGCDEHHEDFGGGSRDVGGEAECGSVLRSVQLFMAAHVFF